MNAATPSPPPRRAAAVRLRGTVAAAVALAAVLPACGAGISANSGHRLAVVAAENVWGSLVTQLGGSRVSVTSIVTDPNADPHDYQSSAGTARAFATADYVIVNGAGYDGWADSLLNANRSGGRTVLDVADLLSRKDGDNPHFWYSPAYVEKVADRITRDLQALDGADTSYFSQQRTALASALQPERDRIAAIRATFPGRRVAATEDVVAYLTGALGLDLITPPAFMRAVAEGNDPPADTVSTLQEQLQSRQATVLIVNRQTSTDVTTTIEHLATQLGIPVVGVTETIQPPDASFQVWMLGELDALHRALEAR